jgi:hypothetical protein
MTQNRTTPGREERLAAKLRENLRRRKQQTRAMEPPVRMRGPSDLPKPDSSG